MIIFIFRKFKMADSFSTLPAEVLMNILPYLSPFDIMWLQKVSERHHENIVEFLKLNRVVSMEKIWEEEQNRDHNLSFEEGPTKSSEVAKQFQDAFKLMTKEATRIRLINLKNCL